MIGGLKEGPEIVECEPGPRESFKANPDLDLAAAAAAAAPAAVGGLWLVAGRRSRRGEGCFSAEVVEIAEIPGSSVKKIHARWISCGFRDKYYV